MILETLEQCTWDDIKIGEVFAWNDCWTICIKLDDKMAGQLASDTHQDYDFSDSFVKDRRWILGTKRYQGVLYKLSLKVQHLWKEE